jgi:UDP:flavonoid glycosyltransferase YjiC (YdhE family)
MAQAPLRILVAALGSHGDVHPFLAVGRELQRRGHDVRMILPAMYEELTAKVGLGFTPAGTVEQFDELSSNPDLWHPVKGFQVIARGVVTSLPWYYDAIVANHEPGRTLLVMSTLLLAGRVAQETLHVPGVTVHLSPVALRSSFQPPRTPPLPIGPGLPRWWNALVYRAIDFLVLDRAMAAGVNEFRRSKGLGPVGRLFEGYIHSPDRVLGLFPDWFAPPQPDWPPQTILTGFPLYDEADITPMDSKLENFLNEGAPPIAITPGSAMRYGSEFFAAAIQTCQKLGRRGILLSRHSEHVPADLPAQIIHVDYAPFSRLLPRCCAIIHHGGIGTLSQGLAAGIPQLVISMAHDQADNGARLKRLGVGDSLAMGRFTGNRAAAMLGALLKPGAESARRSIRQKLLNDQPLARTGAVIEETFGLSTIATPAQA